MSLPGVRSEVVFLLQYWGGGHSRNGDDDDTCGWRLVRLASLPPLSGVWTLVTGAVPAAEAVRMSHEAATELSRTLLSLPCAAAAAWRSLAPNSESGRGGADVARGGCQCSCACGSVCGDRILLRDPRRPLSPGRLTSATLSTASSLPRMSVSRACVSAVIVVSTRAFVLPCPRFTIRCRRL